MVTVCVILWNSKLRCKLLIGDMQRNGRKCVETSLDRVQKGQQLCHFLPSPCLRSVADDIAVFMIYSSTTGLCMMAFDRYLAIVKSLTYTTLMTRRRALYLVASSWLVPLLAYFVPALCTRLNGCSINRKVIWVHSMCCAPTCYSENNNNSKKTSPAFCEDRFSAAL